MIYIVLVKATWPNAPKYIQSNPIQMDQRYDLFRKREKKRDDIGNCLWEQRGAHQYCHTSTTIFGAKKTNRRSLSGTSRTRARTRVRSHAISHRKSENQKNQTGYREKSNRQFSRTRLTKRYLTLPMYLVHVDVLWIIVGLLVRLVLLICILILNCVAYLPHPFPFIETNNLYGRVSHIALRLNM